MNPQTVVEHYTEAYQKLYQRTPRDLQILDHDWIIVNGARMRISELQYLTQQLQQEYKQGLEQRRGLVKRLVTWFKGH